MVLGAYPRLAGTWKPIPALIFSAGLVLLANTPPYEGAILGLMLVLALIHDVWRARKHTGFVLRCARRDNDISWKRVALCIAGSAMVLGISGWAMTRHWKAVTGHALTLPYQVNQRTYGWPLTLP